VKISDWKIGARLGVGIALILLLTVNIGGVGFWSLTQMEGAMTVSEHASDDAKRVAGLTAALDRQALTLAFYTDTTHRQHIEQLGAHLAEVDQAVGAWADDLTRRAPPATAQQVRQISEQFQDYRGQREELVRLKRADPEAAQIQTYFTQEVAPRLQRLSTAMTGLRTQIESEASLASAEARDIFRQGRWMLAGYGLLIFVAGGLIGWRVTRSVTQPIAEAVQVAHAVAAGDLTQSIASSRKDETGQLLEALQSMTGRLRSVVGEVRQGVDLVTTAAGEIASGNVDLSARTEQNAASLEQTAASLEEFTATVSQSAEIASQANLLANKAAQSARDGGDVMQQVVQSMRLITDASTRINDIIGVIDGIAFQTNILALNAAVEAARAGEQGRGFAIVAGEVRNLASRSAEAAKEIKGLIGNSVDAVQMGSIQVAQAGKSMEEIVTDVRRVSDLIGEISAAAAEQRDGIRQVNQAVTNLDQAAQQNTALVQESSAATAALREQARRLTEVVAVFKIQQQAWSGAATAMASSAATAPSMPMKQLAAPRPAAPSKPVAAPAVRQLGNTSNAGNAGNAHTKPKANTDGSTRGQVNTQASTGSVSSTSAQAGKAQDLDDDWGLF
jgi:methyl-accepting chemotaxis protein